MELWDGGWDGGWEGQWLCGAKTKHIRPPLSALGQKQISLVVQNKNAGAISRSLLCKTDTFANFIWSLILTMWSGFLGLWTMYHTNTDPQTLGWIQFHLIHNQSSMMLGARVRPASIKAADQSLLNHSLNLFFFFTRKVDVWNFIADYFSQAHGDAHSEPLQHH